MKDCNECEYFEGYDYSDGTPKCAYCENGCTGYEYCPYNDGANVKKNGVKIEIDAGFMHEYIMHTLQNTMTGEAASVARQEIKSLINDEMKKNVLDETKEQIKSIVGEEIADFMSKEITIGGGWLEPERTLTRTQYLSETIEKELKERFKSDAIKKYAKQEAESAINAYDRKLRDEINAGIKQYFDAATRQVLTENVVSMLMCNDTYMGTLLSITRFKLSKWLDLLLLWKTFVCKKRNLRWVRFSYE